MRPATYWDFDRFALAIARSLPAPACADPLEAPPAPEVKPETRRKLRCEFCECTLAANGDVLVVSDRARKLRKADEEIESLEGTVATLRHQLEEKGAPKPSQDDPKPEGKPEPKKPGFRWF